jgi:NAD(P)-dependent dehydrogenase (short-subunit alcohol dehydrogenase family)
MPKRVLVTAGGSGIGLAIAQAFAEAGDRVHVCDIERSCLEALSGSSGIGTTVADVSDPDQVTALFDDVQSGLGGLDVLVNNAGTSGPTGPIESLSFDDWRRTIAVNLHSQFLCIRLAVPLLKTAGGGSIVNISSTAGLHGYPLRAPYSSAKWGVIGLTKTLAMELGPHDIRVNAICPGSVGGERMDRVVAAEARTRNVGEALVREGFLRQTSMRTFVDAADVAALALFLCSDAGAKISGQALAVDGHTEGLGMNP